MKHLLAAATAAGVLFGAAFGQAIETGPVDGGLGMIPAASDLAEEVHFFHNAILLPIVAAISLLVLGLLLWVAVRYNAKANPVPRKFSHNTLIEILWTAVPIVLLVVIAIPSFEILYKEDVIPDGKEFIAVADGDETTFSFVNDFPASRMVENDEHVNVFIVSGPQMQRLRRGRDFSLAGLGSPRVIVRLKEPPPAGSRVVIRAGRSVVGVGEDREIAMAPSMTLKVTGYQWGWTYSYPDFGDFEFSATPLSREQTTPELFRFAVDNPVVLPVGETVRIVTTARDVIHSWALPPFAVKIDAVPGRINEIWINAEEEGVYYGQCSEICGVKHSYMPIAVQTVSRAAFESWVDEQRALVGLEPMFGAAEMVMLPGPSRAGAVRRSAPEAEESENEGA